MQRTLFRIGTAIAVLALAPIGAFAEESLDIAAAANASLTAAQNLSNNSLELGSIDNSLDFAADIATEAGGAIGLNMTAGDFNLQDNAAVLALLADATGGETYASTSLVQSAFGQSFNGDTSNAHLHNVVSVDISATDDVAGNVGLNAASGVFNIQSNAVAIAAVPGSILAQSFANLSQEARENLSVHNDTVNEVEATIILDGVSGNIGMNLASGVGNVQSNSITIARPF
jgi:hypothetical protein